MRPVYHEFYLIVDGLEEGMLMEDALQKILYKLKSLKDERDSFEKEIEDLRSGVFYATPEAGKPVWHIRQEYFDRAYEIMKERNAKNNRIHQEP